MAHELGCKNDAVDLVDEGSSTEGGQIVRWIVSPSAQSLLVPKPLRHTHFCALLRSPNGTVWMLRSTGQVWTSSRIRQAAAMLERAGDATTMDAKLAARLAHAIEIPTLELVRPLFESIDPAQWDIHRLAVALCMRTLGSAQATTEHHLQNLASIVNQTEAALKTELEDALRRFCAALDPEILDAATVNGHIDGNRYNLLVQPQTRKFRLQFARTFPSFLQCVADRVPEDVCKDLLLTIDKGLPLVKSIAARWKVSPGALRSLIGRHPRLVGEKWESDPRQLARVLDAVCPEDRPTVEPLQWQVLNETVSNSEKLFGRRYLTTPGALSWLRTEMHRLRVKGPTADIGAGLNAGALAKIETFRRALLDVICAGHVQSSVANEQEFVLQVKSVVDHFVVGRNWRRLFEMSHKYATHLTEARAECASQIKLLTGAQFYPLLPEPHRSDDGTRWVRPLVSREAIQAHGSALGQCIAKSHLEAYGAQCEQGEIFLLGIYANEGMPLSTAEFRRKRLILSVGHSMVVVQHTAAGNQRPTAACARAISEVCQRLQSKPHQDHLTTIYRMLDRRKQLGRGGMRQEADLLPVVTAIHRTVGEAAMQRLLVAATGTSLNLSAG